MKVAGLVLAGGRSTRFGSDKASALFHGKPLIAWSIEALRAQTDRLAVNGSDALVNLVDLPQVIDAPNPPDGPLAGLLSGLGWARENGCSHLLTAPCDTPFLPSDMGARFVGTIERLPVIAARAERMHPLCALWRTDALPDLERLVRQAKQPSMIETIGALRGRWLDFPNERAFANLNTRAEFEVAARLPVCDN